MIKDRVSRLRRLMPEFGVDACLVSSPENVRYLSGFTGTSGVLLITAQEGLLVTDFRYVEQAALEAPLFEVAKVESTWINTLQELLLGRPVRRLAFEGSHLTYYLYRLLSETLDGVRLEDARAVFGSLRAVKDEGEIELIRKGVLLVDQAFAHLLTIMGPGISEREIALELEFYLRRRGGERMAFETILASGARAALPHGTASGKMLERGDLVVCDCGVMWRGYASDFTRTVVVDAAPDDWQIEIYQVVLEAQLAGIAAVKPGVPAAEVDAAARRVIEQAGYGAYFGHSTGHGVGLNVHEAPHVSAASKELLEAGMVITIEPGIYLPGRGGVRIEDVAVVRDYGAEVLTTTPKNSLVRV